MIRREFLTGSGTAMALFTGQAGAVSPRSRPLILDGVHDNPGEGATPSAFRVPAWLKANGFNGQILNDYGFLQTAVTLQPYDPRIVPKGSAAYDWAQARAAEIDRYIETCHAAGIAAYVWTDMLVLPKTVKALYGDAVTDAHGKFTFSKPKLVELHQALLVEVAERFPKLDGVVVRTGETYLLNTPHHEGNNPLTVEHGAPTEAVKVAHSVLIRQLRTAFCERGTEVIYRTWAFGGLHTQPDIYHAVTDAIEPHEKLIFSIKHTKGDFHRKYDFNPTLGIGRHPQIVEVQCQREYEGKGAHPNYITSGVIDGFEEYVGRSGPQGLNDLKSSPIFKGVWTWSRGGGWVGPYIKNEFWCALNALVMARWTAAPHTPEADHFDSVLKTVYGANLQSRRSLRKIALLSAKGVLRGRSSLIAQVNEFWIRDQYMGGLTPPDVLATLNAEQWGSLNASFADILAQNKVEAVLAEKDAAVAIWRSIEALSRDVTLQNPDDTRFVGVSCRYGRIKYDIVRQGWIVMLLGLQGDQSGLYETARMLAALKRYDRLWAEWHALAKQEPLCPTLYLPYAFNYPGPVYNRQDGMQASVDHYRSKLNSFGAHS